MQTTTWRSYWYAITAPAASVQGEERQQARLLATLAAALLLISPLVVTIWVLTAPTFVSASSIGVGIFTTLLIIYGLSRTRYHHAGSYLLILMLLAMVVAAISTAPGPMVERMLALKFLVVAILLASMLLPIPVTLLVVGLCVCGTLWFFTRAEVPFAETYSYLVFEVVMSALLITATTLRNTQIVERRQAEAALRDSEARFRHLALQSPDTIYIRNLLSQEIEFINRDEFLGYSLAELRHMDTLLNQIAPGDQERFASAWDELCTSQQSGVMVVDYQIRHKGGGWEWVQHRGIPLVRQPDGMPEQLLIVLTVITDRKRLEEQVLQSQKMEAIGRLAGGIAHDFNNLLTVMNGYADFLLSTLADDDPARHDVAEIASAGARAAALTRQLLTFSRQSLREVSSVSLSVVVRGAETMLRRVIGEDISLVVDLAPDDLHVRANPDQLGQVLLNLVVNARDAMPRGGTLTIATRPALIDATYARARTGIDPGCYALLIVSDTGHGMTPEVRARVFEPFFTTKGPGGGTGLGLAVVHGIVTQSDGQIEIESEPDRGTTFQISLPCLGVGDVPLVAAGPAPATRQGSETVLLVEDDEAVRQMVERSLRQQGYYVLATASGAEALRTVVNYPGPIDLALTDVVMPGQSGPELIADLRRERSQLRVIYMSGYAPDTTLRHGMIEGIHAFLPKPFTPDALARRVREVLDQ